MKSVLDIRFSRRRTPQNHPITTSSRITGCLGITILLLLCITITRASAAIHEYHDEPFAPQSNAFFFLGGSEGLYASERYHNPPSPPAPSLKGKSFIRFESVTFVRTKESAEYKNEMQSRTGLIEAIILEVKDRERIGDALSKSHLICCTPKLSQDKFCTVGEVIIQKNPDNPEWPIRIWTFFEGKNRGFSSSRS